MLGLKNPSVLIAGSGPSGIAMAYNLKEVAGMTSESYRREDLELIFHMY